MQENDIAWTGTLLLPLGNNREAGFTSVGTLAAKIPYSGQRFDTFTKSVTDITKFIIILLILTINIWMQK